MLKEVDEFERIDFHMGDWKPTKMEIEVAMAKADRKQKFEYKKPALPLVAGCCTDNYVYTFCTSCSAWCGRTSKLKEWELEKQERHFFGTGGGNDGCRAKVVLWISC